MSKKGVLTVISGFSGAGKGTIMKQLIEKYPYFLSISATTRKPREGEVNGREYYFHTREEFEHMIEQWSDYPILKLLLFCGRKWHQSQPPGLLPAGLTA